MKYILIFIFLIGNFSAAQTTSLKVRETLEFKDTVKAEEVLSIYTTATGMTGILRSSKKGLLFDIFDESLNKTYNKLIETDKKEEYAGDLYFEEVAKIFTVFSPDQYKRVIYCHVFNLKNKTHEKIELFSTAVEKNQSLFSSNNKRQTSFALSPNGNYLAIATDNIKKNINSYSVRVFDANTLKILYEKDYREGSEKHFEPNDVVIDDNGTVYALGKLFLEGRTQKKKGIANYDFILNKISESDITGLKISLNEEHIKSLTISQKDNELKLLGFYSERNVNRIKGGCSFVIDVAGKMTIKTVKNTKLPLSVYEDLYGYRKADKKQDEELSRFFVDYISEDSSGNTYMLAEEFYITQQYVSMGTMGGYTVPVEHYDDILILKFNANGDLEWGRSIFKRSTAPSYNAFVKNDKLHIILNSGKNLTEKTDGRTKVSKGFLESTSLYDIVFSTDGEVSYDKIQDNKGNTYYTPYYGTYRNEKFIMVSSKAKKQFMILE